MGLVKGLMPPKKAQGFRDLDVGERVFIQPERFVQMEIALTGDYPCVMITTLSNTSPK